ncbi:DUF6356 family protein [Sphingosinicella rhizophila]|uniref:DUF6356 family protein n=1 Tax=Sphingosinicella rhizophila TaxID=3050082 RepID=A0ABU3Q5I9_9SPHN|nr:DUF6356 family protein [Sphingosinicella sp. GR2756]MDT9598671.1 DUF6356 family protein [Sphingosinicella sp. GR2756]
MRHFFTSHPASVGETYFEHMHMAFGFGATMIVSGIACLIHGLVPAWCVTTGSKAVTRLHSRMVLKRRSKPAHMAHVLDFVI